MKRPTFWALCLAILLQCSLLHAWPPGGNGGGGGGKPPKDNDPPPAEPLYEYVGLGNLGGSSLYTFAFNNLNDVAGQAYTADQQQHAFLCTTDASGARLPMFDLNDFLDVGDPLILTHANGLNDHGHVAGYAEIDETLLGFLFAPPAGAAATMTIDGPAYVLDGVEVSPEIHVVHPPFAEISGLRDVNSNGLAVGVYRDSSGFAGAFTYDMATGVYTDLGAPPGSTNFGPDAINDANEIAGTSYSGPSNSINLAWRYTASEGYVSLGVLDESLAEPEASVAAMNEFGEIVGSSKVVRSRKGKNVSTEFHGYHYASGVMTDLGVGSPWGINNWGDIVVQDSAGLHILFGDPSLGEVHLNAVTDLPQELIDIALSGWDPLSYPQINDAGYVAGQSGESFAGVPEEAFLLIPIVP